MIKAADFMLMPPTLSLPPWLRRFAFCFSLCRLISYFFDIIAFDVFLSRRFDALPLSPPFSMPF